MSAVVRQAIADAANTVAGISVSPYFRQSTKAGDGMVRLDRIEHPNPFGGVTHWQVLIALPQDIASAEKYLETKVPALTEALNTQIVVRSVTPQELILDTGKIPVVVINGHRES